MYDPQTLRIELGIRVLYHLEPLPRDLRWFRNLMEKR